MTKIKRYKYYFRQIEKPIIIEAESRKVADSILIELNRKSGNWMNIDDLVDVRIESLLIGVSVKKIKNKNYIWVGINHSQNGWIEEEEYLKIVINNKKQFNKS